MVCLYVSSFFLYSFLILSPVALWCSLTSACVHVIYLNCIKIMIIISAYNNFAGELEYVQKNSEERLIQCYSHQLPLSASDLPSSVVEGYRSQP